jgi:hypothetical protein
MHLLFLDESGSVPPRDKVSTRYFVVGGVVIAEDQWHNIEEDLNRLKVEYSVAGEIKWRYFGQKTGREDKENTLRHLGHKARDAFRKAIFGIITKYKSNRIIATVTDIQQGYSLREYIETPANLYWYTYKPLTERFQYYLQD